MYLLQELASGYALYERTASEEIGQALEDIQKAILDYPRFSKSIALKSFIPFKSAAHALENINDVSEGIMNPHLKSFLEMNMPKPGKKTSVALGVFDPNLGGSIKAELGYDCVSNDSIKELIRGIRFHSDKLLKQLLKDGDLDKAQLGLGHAYSRAKVKFNVNRVDNMITQSIALLDQLDKDVNTFSMRVREWFSWHFPEMGKIVSDNAMFAKLVKAVKNKSDLSEASLPALEEITGDAAKAQQILDASKSSMGTDISIIDMLNIERFADRVIALNEYRKSLYTYLVNKMHAIAPNVSALIGEIVGARLIAQAGSLTNLAKYPASTIQILGAEKALFRALKTKGNTPKYGLIYHSTFIGRAAAKNKGRISRILANKVSIASRIDCFLDTPTSKFGEMLRDQIEDRLKFYEEGVAPRKNTEVMADALKAFGLEQAEGDTAVAAPETPKDKKKKKKAKKEDEEEMEVDSPAAPEDASDKKKKKKKAVAEDDATMEESSSPKRKSDADADGETKKKKKKKKDTSDE